MISLVFTELTDILRVEIDGWCFHVSAQQLLQFKIQTSADMVPRDEDSVQVGDGFGDPEPEPPKMSTQDAIDGILRQKRKVRNKPSPSEPSNQTLSEYEEMIKPRTQPPTMEELRSITQRDVMLRITRDR